MFHDIDTGRGNIDPSPDRAGRRFRIEDLADDAVAVADELGIERFIPVGYSLGGAVAQMIWKRHPERVSGLVLAATARNYRGSGLESTFFRLLPPLLVPLALSSPPTLHASTLEAGLLRDLEGGVVEGPEFSRWAMNELKMTNKARSIPSHRSPSCSKVRRERRHGMRDQLTMAPPMPL